MENDFQKLDKLLSKQSLSQKTVLTMDELAEYTGLGKSYLYKLSMAKKIPGMSRPMGKKLFFDREKIDQWLLGNPAMTTEEMETKAATYISTK